MRKDLDWDGGGYVPSAVPASVNAGDFFNIGTIGQTSNTKSFAKGC